jgi:hypothetical protein
VTAESYLVLVLEHLFPGYGTNVADLSVTDAEFRGVVQDWMDMQG